MSQIDEYLKQVVVRNGSDLHFIAGEPPRARIYGELQILAPETLPDPQSHMTAVQSAQGGDGVANQRERPPHVAADPE